MANTTFDLVIGSARREYEEAEAEAVRLLELVQRIEDGEWTPGKKAYERFRVESEIADDKASAAFRRLEALRSSYVPAADLIGA